MACERDLHELYDSCRYYRNATRVKQLLEGGLDPNVCFKGMRPVEALVLYVEWTTSDPWGLGGKFDTWTGLQPTGAVVTPVDGTQRRELFGVRAAEEEKAEAILCLLVEHGADISILSTAPRYPRDCRGVGSSFLVHRATRPLVWHAVRNGYLSLALQLRGYGAPLGRDEEELDELLRLCAVVRASGHFVIQLFGGREGDGVVRESCVGELVGEGGGELGGGGAREGGVGCAGGGRRVKGVCGAAPVIEGFALYFAARPRPGASDPPDCDDGLVWAMYEVGARPHPGRLLRTQWRALSRAPSALLHQMWADDPSILLRAVETTVGRRCVVWRWAKGGKPSLGPSVTAEDSRWAARLGSDVLDMCVSLSFALHQRWDEWDAWCRVRGTPVSELEKQLIVLQACSYGPAVVDEAMRKTGVTDLNFVLPRRTAMFACREVAPEVGGGDSSDPFGWGAHRVFTPLMMAVRRACYSYRSHTLLHLLSLGARPRSEGDEALVDMLLGHRPHDADTLTALVKHGAPVSGCSVVDVARSRNPNLRSLQAGFLKILVESARVRWGLDGEGLSAKSALLYCDSPKAAMAVVKASGTITATAEEVGALVGRLCCHRAARIASWELRESSRTVYGGHWEYAMCEWRAPVFELMDIAASESGVSVARIARTVYCGLPLLFLAILTRDAAFVEGVLVRAAYTSDELNYGVDMRTWNAHVEAERAAAGRGAPPLLQGPYARWGDDDGGGESRFLGFELPAEKAAGSGGDVPTVPTPDHMRGGEWRRPVPPDDVSDADYEAVPREDPLEGRAGEGVGGCDCMQCKGGECSFSLLQAADEEAEAGLGGRARLRFGLPEDDERSEAADSDGSEWGDGPGDADMRGGVAGGTVGSRASTGCPRNLRYLHGDCIHTAVPEERLYFVSLWIVTPQTSRVPFATPLKWAIRRACGRNRDVLCVLVRHGAKVRDLSESECRALIMEQDVACSAAVRDAFEEREMPASPWFHREVTVSVNSHASRSYCEWVVGAVRWVCRCSGQWEAAMRREHHGHRSYGDTIAQRLMHRGFERVVVDALRVQWADGALICGCAGELLRSALESGCTRVQGSILTWLDRSARPLVTACGVGGSGGVGVGGSSAAGYTGNCSSTADAVRALRYAISYSRLPRVSGVRGAWGMYTDYKLAHEERGWMLRLLGMLATVDVASSADVSPFMLPSLRSTLPFVPPSGVENIYEPPWVVPYGPYHPMYSTPPDPSKQLVVDNPAVITRPTAQLFAFAGMLPEAQLTKLLHYELSFPLGDVTFAAELVMRGAELSYASADLSTEQRAEIGLDDYPGDRVSYHVRCARVWFVMACVRARGVECPKAAAVDPTGPSPVTADGSPVITPRPKRSAGGANSHKLEASGDGPGFGGERMYEKDALGEVGVRLMELCFEVGHSREEWAAMFGPLLSPPPRHSLFTLSCEEIVAINDAPTPSERDALILERLDADTLSLCLAVCGRPDVLSWLWSAQRAEVRISDRFLPMSAIVGCDLEVIKVWYRCASPHNPIASPLLFAVADEIIIQLISEAMQGTLAQMGGSQFVNKLNELCLSAVGSRNMKAYYSLARLAPQLQLPAGALGYGRLENSRYPLAPIYGLMASHRQQFWRRAIDAAQGEEEYKLRDHRQCELYTRYGVVVALRDGDAGLLECILGGSVGCMVNSGHITEEDKRKIAKMVLPTNGDETPTVSNLLCEVPYKAEERSGADILAVLRSFGLCGECEWWSGRLDVHASAPPPGREFVLMDDTFRRDMASMQRFLRTYMF